MKTGLFRSFITRWPLAVAAVFFIYSLVLLANAYRSQFQLVSEANARIAADSRRVAEAVADLITERRQITAELAEGPEVANYLINKALGMSLRYGLNANLAAIEERFRRQLERANLRGEQILERIVFYDVDGMVLVDLAPGAGILPLPPAEGRNAALLIDPAARHIVVSAPVIFKAAICGKVATVGDLGQLSRDLIQKGSSSGYREILITAQGRELPLLGAQTPMAEALVKALALLPENKLTSTAGLPGGDSVVAGELALRSAIPGADLSLVTLVDEKTAYGQITSRFFLYSASVVPLIVLIAAFMFERGRRVQVALAQSEQRFHTIFDNIRDAIFIVDIDDGSILEANPSVLELYGITLSELPGLCLDDISEPRSDGDLQYWTTRMAAAADGEPQFFALRARRRNGELFWSEINMLRASIDGHDRLLLVARDITQRKEQEQELVSALEYQRQLNKRLEAAQNQLLQSEKMASLGQLAAGVAHEINNPVGFVNSNLTTLKRYFADLLELLSLYEQDERELSPTNLAEVAALKEKIDIAYLREDVANLMTESIDGLKRVKRIVQDLKDFSHVGESEKQMASLEQGLDSTLNMVWNELKYKAEIVKEYAGLPDIECIPTQINQVFMNLLVNAAQAIEVQGRITVRTGQQGEEVWVEVEDSGCGIPAENLKRIFDPFFTTKPVGKGTGLGLSLSYGIVKRHHGRFVLNSEPGKGTVFRVWLPLRQPERETA